MLIKDKNLKILLENIRVNYQEEGHVYSINGQQLLSVTQLLKEGEIGVDYSAVNPEVLEKARLRGEAIHYQVEDAICNNNFFELSDEGKQILSYLNPYYKKNEYVDLISEGVLYSNNPYKPYAGRFDLLGKLDGEYILYDIKTMKTWTGALEAYTRWQLNLYAKALRECGIDVKRLIVLKFKDDELKPLEVEKIDDEKINKFLKTGTIDKQLITLSNNELTLFQKIKDKERELKELEEQIKGVKRALYDYMQKNDILNATTEDGSIKITRVKDSVVESIDKTRLRKEEPEVYTKYKKETKREGYVVLTILH